MELNSDAVAHYKNAGVSIRPCPAPVTAKKPRPSPRTQGVDEEGNIFQKFGTQQLKYVDPTQPALGVVEKDVGKGWQLITTGGKVRGSGLSTAFSQQFQSGITGHQRTVPRAEAIKMQDEKLAEMGIPKLPDLGELEFPEIGLPTWEDLFGANDKHGCECQACKNGTGQCSDKIPQCDAWDLLCEGSGGATVGVVGGTNWFFWIKIVLAVIGIGILLWLLRPLFGIAKNVTGITKSAVTRVNGMR